MARKWNWNFDYFDGDDKLVAYWAGFIMADGNITQISTNSYCLAIAIDKNDIEHLYTFCDDIGVSRDAIFIQTSKPKQYGGRIISGGSYPGIHLHHTGLKDKLYRWGVVPRKSYNFVAPRVSDDLLPHYLRGWADGDGQIYRYGRGSRFTVSGNPVALEWYGEALKRLGYLGNYSFQDRLETTSILYIGGKHQVAEVCDLLLVDSEFCLDRKWDNVYEDKRNLISKNCEWCGKEFGVSKFRSEHPTNGRFCSRKCFNENQKSPVVDNQKQCSGCKEWTDLDEFSGHPHYCRQCWREYNEERRRKLGVKKQKLVNTKVIDGVVHRECAKCGVYFPKGNRAYCTDCWREYMREHRAKKKGS